MVLKDHCSRSGWETLAIQIHNIMYFDVALQYLRVCHVAKNFRDLHGADIINPIVPPRRPPPMLTYLLTVSTSPTFAPCSVPRQR